MAVERKLMTAEELAALPDDGMRQELIDGELRVMSPPFADHGAAAGRIHAYVGWHVVSNGLGEILTAETGFILRRDPDRVRAPDIAVILNERIPPDGIPHSYCPFPADLVVEVVSSGDTASEVADKVEDWLRFGTRLVWVVYPSAPRLVVHRADGTARTLGADDEVDGGDVLPEFRMKLRNLLHPFKR